MAPEQKNRNPRTALSQKGFREDRIDSIIGRVERAEDEGSSQLGGL